MIYLKDKYQVEKLYQAGQIVKETLCHLENSIESGVSTIELDKIAEEYILSKNAIPGFKGLYGYPATLCISIDDEVVHGIPGKRKLSEGEIVSIDVLKPDKNELKISDDEELDYELHKDLEEIHRRNELRDLHQALS